jgi:hypothetical protein
MMNSRPSHRARCTSTLPARSKVRLRARLGIDERRTELDLDAEHFVALAAPARVVALQHRLGARQLVGVGLGRGVRAHRMERAARRSVRRCSSTTPSCP